MNNMDVRYNGDCPEWTVGRHYDHCHSAGVLAALSQEEKILQCIRFLEEGIAVLSNPTPDTKYARMDSGVRSQIVRKFNAEVAADQELLKCVQQALLDPAKWGRVT